MQRDFLKFTGQQILKVLRNESSPVQGDLMVLARDRRFQVWERNSLSIPLWSNNVMWQKLTYIHYNPVKAGLCNQPEEYKYSSASFYHKGVRKWNFLTHCSGLKCLLVRNTNKGGKHMTAVGPYNATAGIGRALRQQVPVVAMPIRKV